jgi:hypothetical protein
VNCRLILPCLKLTFNMSLFLKNLEIGLAQVNLFSLSSFCIYLLVLFILIVANKTKVGIGI